MADQQNSLAESALDMMSHNNNENLDIMMIKNNSLKMNRESFSKHLEKLCRGFLQIVFHYILALKSHWLI